MATKALRYFLYLNVDLVGAFLEQLEGGRIQATESVTEGRQNIQGGVNIALVHLGGSGERLTGYRETKTIYYDLYNRLENGLRTQHKLIDLTISRKKSAHKLGGNQFFLAHGAVTFIPEWSSWKSLGYILTKFSEWIAQLQPLPQEQQDQAVPLHHELTNGAQGLGPPTQVNALPKLPDEPPEEIRSLIKPESINIALNVPEEPCKFTGSALLKHFTEDHTIELSSGQKTHRVFVMGLTSELSQEWIRFIPIAMFATV